MTVDRFLPGTHPTTQPQHAQGKDWTPLPPSIGRAKKKQRVADQLPRVSSDAHSKTPPLVSSEITIWELTGDSRLAAQVSINVASSP